MTRTALAIERFFSFINCPNHTESRKPNVSLNLIRGLSNDHLSVLEYDLVLLLFSVT